LSERELAANAFLEWRRGVKKKKQKPKKGKKIKR